MKKSTVKAEAQVESTEPKALANINGKYVFNETAIEWKAASNPKRPSGKAHARFEAYSKASTVGEFLSLGGTTADLKYDESKGFLALN